MLDDVNVLNQRDPGDVLGFASDIYQDAAWDAVVGCNQHDDREIRNIVLAGMGGSALAADILQVIVKDWLGVPFEIVKGYDLPGYAWQNTLVITSSQSGNTEETLACFETARERGCQMAALTAGGKLLERVQRDNILHVQIPEGGQPRMATIKHLRALLAIFKSFGLIGDTLARILAESKDWLGEESDRWHRDVPVQNNYAKQLALLSAGKTPVFYGGPFTAPLARKWKISWNENAKNMAFYNQYPEFNHNEFIGWSSHPVEKPFVVFDLVSDFDSDRNRERMELSERLLSGKRPARNIIELKGENDIVQAAWACILADIAGCYAAILNGVNPEPVDLVERFKVELS